MELYEVGGAVRNRFLSMPLPSKDEDIAVEGLTYEQLRDWLLDNDYRICAEEPEYLRIKAGKRNWQSVDFMERVERNGATLWLPAKMSEAPKDWVLCHTDRSPKPKTLAEGVSILEDLASRDFTMNAIAIKSDGQILDPHNGREDIQSKLIRAVGEPFDCFVMDPGRLYRAIRLAVELDFTICRNTWNAIIGCNDLAAQVGPDRVREELLKSFRIDTLRTLRLLNATGLTDYTFTEQNQLWLKPTNERK